MFPSPADLIKIVMTAPKQINRKSKSSLIRKRSLARKQSNALIFEVLERRELLAAITVGNATDIVSATADTSSIAALVANDGGDGISLREAVTAANNTAGEDAITFDADVFTGGASSLIRLTQGEIEITESLSIDGGPSGGVVITGDANGDDILTGGTNITNVSASFGGVDGANDDLLDDNSRVLNFSYGSGNLTLTDLTITGGRLTDPSDNGAGVRSLGNLSVVNGNISGNSTTGSQSLGGGIYISNGDLSLTFSTVSGNRGSGGGIASSNGDVSLTGSTVSDNQFVFGEELRSGGGIHVSSGNVSLIDSNIRGNASTGPGGGVYISNGNAFLTRSTVRSNSVIQNGLFGEGQHGGGIYISNGDLSLTDSEVIENTASGSGGGVSSSGGNLMLTSSTVNENTSFLGGGIYSSGGNVSSDNSTVSENNSFGPGGGIYSINSDVSLTESTVSQNSGRDFGGGIFNSNGNVVLTNSTVSGNYDGSGVLHGGGIGSLNGNVSLTNSAVSGNSGITGAGIYSSGSVLLTNSAVSENISSSDGGGLSIVRGDLSAINSSVNGNSSIAADGAGIRIYDGSLSLTNTTVSGNFSAVNSASTDSSGGGIFSESSTVLLVNSTVADNEIGGRGNGGGIAFNANGSDAALLTIQNSIVAGNRGARQFSNDLYVSVDVMTDNLIVDYSLIGSTLRSQVTTATGTGNILDQPAFLAPLANYNATQTHALLRGSPAIDAGSNALAVDENGNPLAVDQRGGSRVLGTVDMGAFELGDAATFETRSLVVTTNQDVADPTDGLTSLREAIRFANDPTVGVNNDGDADGDGSTADAVAFDSSVFTGGDNNLIRLTQGELLATQSISIDGSLVGGVLITGDANDDDITIGDTHITNVSASFGVTAGAPNDLLDDNSRVLNFSGESGNATLNLQGLTITGGRTTAADYGDGAGINAVGDVTLLNSTVSGNSSSASGGAIRVYNGDVSLTGSTVSGNRSVTGGGGIATISGYRGPVGNVSLINSTVSDNHSDSCWRRNYLLMVNRSLLSLTDSEVNGNSSLGSGGGIFAGGRFSEIVITDSDISNNRVFGGTDDMAFLAEEAYLVSLVQ